MGWKVKHIHTSSVKTTQDEAKKNSHQLSPETVIAYTADEQTEGKGTHGRRWLSPPHVNLYVTFSFQIISSSITPFNLPQVVGYSVVQTLEKFGISSQLKWVNDVLVDGNKCAGIYCESENQGNISSHHVGIGININMDQTMCDSLDQPVTSMMLALGGKKLDKHEVFSVLQEFFINNVELYFKQGFDNFYKRISDITAFKNQVIVFDKEGDGKPADFVNGTVLGIDNSGQLRLKIEGEEQQFCNGRILRGKEITAAYTPTPSTVIPVNPPALIPQQLIPSSTQPQMASAELPRNVTTLLRDFGVSADPHFAGQALSPTGNKDITAKLESTDVQNPADSSRPKKP